VNDVKAWSCGEIASRLNGELAGDPEVRITGVQSVDDARAGDITFITDRKYASRWPECHAGAVIVSRELDLPDDQQGRPVIRVEDATLGSFALLSMFAPDAHQPHTGIDDSASVDPSATLGAGVAIGPHVSIGPCSAIGDQTVLHAGARIGRDVAIGKGCEIHSNVVIRDRVRIGNRVCIHQNASIGADGFGYRPAPDGTGLIKAPHIGTVVIEDDVEIGAGTCIDRAKFGETRIGAGTKIDNLVQIGHNCHIGRSCLIVAQTGLSGSVTVEDGVIIGGQVGVGEHRTIRKGARIGAQSGIMWSVEPGAEVMGYPAVPLREFLRMHATLRTLSDSPGRADRRGRKGSESS